jgi:mannitol/fructose-specific phosphotransferase system IIA component (Ntr-type)
MRAMTELPPSVTGIPAPLSVAGAMSPLRVNLNLLADNRDGVLRELVTLVIPPHEKRRATMLFKALKAREELCSTCVNEGVAIPHSRNALVGLVEHPILAYGRHARGVNFGALDGKPVHHFFLLCAPNVRDHLQLLGRLARLVHRAEFRAQLAAVQQPEALIALVQAAEQTL